MTFLTFRRVIPAIFLAALLTAPAFADPLGHVPKRERGKGSRAPFSEKKGAVPPSEPSLQSLYEAVYEKFLKEDYASAVELSEKYLARTPTPHEEDILYLQGLSLMKLGRTHEAREALWRAEQAFGDAYGKSDAAISRADTFWMEGDFAAARAGYQSALMRYPDSPKSEYVRAKLSLPDAVRNPGPLQKSAIEEIPLFSVQVGAFSQAANASALAETLRGQGFEVFTDSAASSRSTRVRVGKFGSRQEARQLASRLKKTGHPARVVTLDTDS